jgi:hypothetical protein
MTGRKRNAHTREKTDITVPIKGFLNKYNICKASLKIESRSCSTNIYRMADAIRGVRKMTEGTFTILVTGTPHDFEHDL